MVFCDGVVEKSKTHCCWLSGISTVLLMSWCGVVCGVGLMRCSFRGTLPQHGKQAATRTLHQGRNTRHRLARDAHDTSKSAAPQHGRMLLPRPGAGRVNVEGFLFSQVIHEHNFVRVATPLQERKHTHALLEGKVANSPQVPCLQCGSRRRFLVGGTGLSAAPKGASDV